MDILKNSSDVSVFLCCQSQVIEHNGVDGSIRNKFSFGFEDSCSPGTQPCVTSSEVIVSTLRGQVIIFDRSTAKVARLIQAENAKIAVLDDVLLVGHGKGSISAYQGSLPSTN